MAVRMPAFWNRMGKVSMAPPIMELISVNIVVTDEFYLVTISLLVPSLTSLSPQY